MKFIIATNNAKKLKELEIAFEEAEIKPLFAKFKKLADKKNFP